MVDFELSVEQAALREITRDLLTAECPSRLVRSVAEAGPGLDEKLWARGAGMGWTGLTAPVRQGGTEQGLAELCLVAEELGRAAAPGPWLETALAAAAAAARAETRHLAEEFAEGRLKAAFVHSAALRARSDDGGVVLSGRARALYAGSADWLLVVVPSGTEPYVLLVPTDSAHIERRNALDLTRSLYDVDFDRVRVAADHVTGGHVLYAEQGQAQRLLDSMRVLIAADALGVGERLLEMTVAHVTVREQFGRPLGGFQAVKHKAADMSMALQALRAAVYYAAMTLDAGVADASLAVAVAKGYAAETVPDVAGQALQLHGGIGFTWEHDLHLYLRRATADAALFGTASYHHGRVLDLLTSDAHADAVG
ncbi:acyl-CoA dehydrogenase family protein [Streptomyces sp. NPDC023723]|uniref:acyl-CoA dehydrogenase family protein n=1 Tax=Streptomyces sp. NPDC023723 TaxID=3154323 RepID=UPI00340084B5